jgi:hypothetical protein
MMTATKRKGRRRIAELSTRVYARIAAEQETKRQRRRPKSAPVRKVPSRKIDPEEIRLRRAARFTDRGGLYERFERFQDGLGGLGFGRRSGSGPVEERRGNGLVEFRDVVRWLVSVGIDRTVVIERFLLSARHGEFGRRGPQERIDRLFDLGGFCIFAPGQYPLRPSYITVEESPESMRARRSVWAKWIQDQGWPLPSWLPRSTLIEHEPAPASTRPAAQPASTAEPAPAPNGARRRGNRPINDDVLVARGLELYHSENGRSYLAAAKIVVEELSKKKKMTLEQRAVIENRLRKKMAKADGKQG